MKTVIIDDVALAREELRRLLAVHPDIEVVGEAANVTEALRVLPALRPELVFLDIQMPGRSGFDLLAALPAPHPKIIFVTAYDAFALRAFEVNALDYLLKPVPPERLAAALDRVRHLSSSDEEADAGCEPAGLGPLQADDRIYLREADRCWLVPVNELRLLEATGNYTRVHFHAERPLVHRPLAALEARLPGRLFLRASRSQLVNHRFIERVEPWFGGGLKAVLAGGGEVEFSRRQAQALRERLAF